MEDTVYYLGNELYHYGVLGMRWKHRKARREAIKEAKRARKLRDAKIQNRYFKTIENLERGYKRFQNFSKADEAKELRADTLARNSWKKSKAQMKSDIANAKAQYKTNIAKEKQERKQQKIEKRNNRTGGQIAARGVLNHIGASVIGGAAYRAARNMGADTAAKVIAGATNVYTTGNAVNTVYQSYKKHQQQKGRS